MFLSPGFSFFCQFWFRGDDFFLLDFWSLVFSCHCYRFAHFCQLCLLCSFPGFHWICGSSGESITPLCLIQVLVLPLFLKCFIMLLRSLRFSVNRVSLFVRWSSLSTSSCGCIAFFSFAATRASPNSSMIVTTIVSVSTIGMCSRSSFLSHDFGLLFWDGWFHWLIIIW